MHLSAEEKVGVIIVEAASFACSDCPDFSTESLDAGLTHLREHLPWMRDAKVLVLSLKGVLDCRALILDYIKNNECDIQVRFNHDLKAPCTKSQKCYSLPAFHTTTCEHNKIWPVHQ